MLASVPNRQEARQYLKGNIMSRLFAFALLALIAGSAIALAQNETRIGRPADFEPIHPVAASETHIALFNFPAGKLPVSFVNLAAGSLREQETAIRALHHCGSHVDDLVSQTVAYLRLRASCATSWRPTQSRANCQATRPLRDPRSNAHCKASCRTSSISTFVLASLPSQ